MSIVAALAVVSGLAAGGRPTPAVRAADPPVPVRIFLDRTRYAPGMVGHVRVHTGEPGYLLVLYAEPDGHVTIAFPLDPGQSSRVRADTDIAILRRGTADAFSVDDSSGRGTWYAAISHQPFLLDSIAVNGHWDYRVIPRADSQEAEGALTGFVEGLSVSRFDYDIVTFTIGLPGSLSALDNPSAAGSAPNAPHPAPAPPASPPPEPPVPPSVGPWGPGDWWPWWLPPRGWPGPYYDGAVPTPAEPTVRLVAGRAPPTPGSLHDLVSAGADERLGDRGASPKRGRDGGGKRDEGGGKHDESGGKHDQGGGNHGGAHR